MLKTTLTTVKAFIAGVLALLIFHQGGLAGLHYFGYTPVAAYVTAPHWPLGVPALLSWCLWGGVWGVVLWGLIRGAEAAGYYVGAMILAAVLLSVVFLFVVMPLAGQPLAGGWDTRFIAGVVLLNALWGLGDALFMRVFKPPI